MVEKAIIFNGSDKDFKKIISERVDNTESTISFAKLIEYYDARSRISDYEVYKEIWNKRLIIDYCIVNGDDYESVHSHVLSNFITVITQNCNIKKLFVQNPPRKVLNSIKKDGVGQIEYCCSKYAILSREKLKDIYHELNARLYGQESCKREIISGIYRLTVRKAGRPVVLLLYGPSGVGKTESAKIISDVLGGNVTRIQFSMMQTEEAYNYVFGSEHSKGSMAHDLAKRESNVVLIDEFDKVNNVFYNAFYQLFDEGKFEDINYSIDMNHAIVILTSNFTSEIDIKKTLGSAMYSRIGCCIKYSDLSTEQKINIVRDYYNEIVHDLNAEEKNCINNSNIYSWFIDNANRYDNIRILKHEVENAVFEKLTEKFIIADENKNR